MQFLRRRKNNENAPAAMNDFFGTVGSPIKMRDFDRHMERRFKDDANQPANHPTTPRASAAAAAARPADNVRRRPHHRRRHSLEGLPNRNATPTPGGGGGGGGAKQSPMKVAAAKPTAKDDSYVSVNADAVTIDAKKKLVLHKEIQRHQREQQAHAKPKTPPKHDILSVHDSSDDSNDDGQEDVATVKKAGRDRRGSTEFIGQKVEPVQQLNLDGARKAKIPHFMSAWFNADNDDKKAAAAAAAAAEKETRKAAAPTPTPAAVAAESKPSPADDDKALAGTNPKLSGMTTRGYSPHINFGEITLGRMIGEGAFGKVYEGKWRGKGVAVKVLVCQDLRSDILHEFQSEVEIMSVLRHPNICRLLGACMDPPHRALVVELMQRGSLWGVLRTHRKTLDMDKRTRFIYDTAKGMAYLHHFERPILHRDLKSPNLLVDKNYNIKLSDFGLARVKAHVQTMTGNCGTVQWMAPEVLGNQKYTEKADVFSFGIVLWEIMTGECPYDGMNQIQAALGVLNRNLRPNIPKDCPPFFSRLMKACWNRQPELRPSFPHIVSAFRTYQSSLSETRATSSAAASANAAVAASIAAS